MSAICGIRASHLLLSEVRMRAALAAAGMDARIAEIDMMMWRWWTCSPTRAFPADAFTREVIGELVRGAANNIWRMEITPGEVSAYRLTRSTFENALRWAFDLTSPVASPLAPGRYEDTEPTHGPDR